MKNACIVCKQGKSKLSSSDWAILDSFRSSGYAFDELRVLFRADENTLLNALTSLKSVYDDILLITDPTSLPVAKTVAERSFSDKAFQANGVFAEGKKTLFLLVDEKDAVQTTFVPYLRRKYGDRRAKTTLRTVGANDALIEQLIAKAKALGQGKTEFSRTRNCGEDVVDIFYDESAPKMLIDDVLRVFAEGLGDTVYALEDVSLAEQLVFLLKLRNQKISIAESFTGGGIARKITSVSGASAVYFEGLNTYDESSKIKRLGVSEYTLKTSGAVSDQTAYEMASGLIATGDCDISVATTGIAGPNSDKSGQPVGLCYIAIGTKERVYVYRYKFNGTREEITETAINYALFHAYNHLKNM